MLPVWHSHNQGSIIRDMCKSVVIALIGQVCLWYQLRLSDNTQAFHHNVSASSRRVVRLLFDMFFGKPV